MNSVDIKKNLAVDIDEGIASQKVATSNQNFGLTKIQFDNIVLKLKDGDESLFETIFLAHFEDCMTYLKSTFKCIHEVAYDTTMDTLVEFRQKVLSDKITYGNLKYLFTRMACNIYIKATVKENKLKEIFLQADEDNETFEDQLASLKKAWNEISTEEKKLLEKYYYLDIPLNKIAELDNKTDASLRKQKQRAVEKLRSIFFKNYH